MSGRSPLRGSGLRPDGLSQSALSQAEPLVPNADDYDDMHHAFGRPLSPNVDCYRNYYCVGVETDTAKRFEALGWWDFGNTINGGRDGIFHVNGAGEQALAEWMGGHLYQNGRWIALAGEAGTAETPKRDSVHEHATAKPERPSPTLILPKKERTK